MKAAIYERFGGPILIENLPDSNPPDRGVVIRVGATGICRSDWYGWQGHDSDIVLPHVPGHELAGEIVAVGSEVKQWREGDRVTVPFVGGCGHCEWCESGNHQVCDHQFQPGFTGWGSFAEYVAIDYADFNLVRLPENMTYVTAASLGCRLVTAFRGVVDVAGIQAGEYIAVYGCGGVGLSTIMIARAKGAFPIAVDIDDEKLKLAESLGAEFTVNAKESNPSQTIREWTKGGSHVTVDALGSKATAREAILSLRKLGRHVQIGLLEGEDRQLPVPMDKVIANEWKILGSHGIQAFRYEEIFTLIREGKLDPKELITDIVDLEKGVEILMHMDREPPLGMAVIDMM